MKRIGKHVRAGRHSLAWEILSALESGAQIVQIFVAHPQKYEFVNLAGVKELGFSGIYVHSSYLSPLSDKFLWFIEKQIKIAAGLSAIGFIIHLPNKEIPEICRLINKINNPDHVPILLELPSNTIYTSPAEIREISAKTGCRLCIDTAHVYGSGVNIRTREDAAAFFRGLPIGLIHLNGNIHGLGSKRDVHCLPFSPDDKIWHGISFADSGVSVVANLDCDIIQEFNKPAQAPESWSKNYRELERNLRL